MSKSAADRMNVAIKRVPYVSTKDKRKALQEVRFLRYCGEHPNVVGIHRAHLVKDEVWMVMEYLEGATLMQAVSVHKFSESQIAYIARYIVKALAFLHENQIAHRDLKSSNIMLTCSGSVKVIDLGLCTDISQGQLTHMVGSVRSIVIIDEGNLTIFCIIFKNDFRVLWSCLTLFSIECELLIFDSNFAPILALLDAS